MRRTVIIGTGSCIPSRRVSNDEFLSNRFFMDYDQPIDPADIEKTVGKFQEIKLNLIDILISVNHML